MSFGDRLRDLRVEKNMTQEDLSKKLNVSRATVGRYETNERFPDKDILKKIADIFDVSLDFLLGRTDNRSSFSKKQISLNKNNYNYNSYRELEDKIKEILLAEGIMSNDEPVPKDVLEKVFKYGINAAIEIIKLEKKLEE